MPPLELISGIGGVVLGGILKLWGMKMQNEHERNVHTLQALGAAASITKEAREYGSKDKDFSFARRTVVLLSVFSIIVVPLVAPLFFPDIPVNHGWTEWQGGFWFFTEGKDVMKWHQVTGIVITPMHTNLMAGIVGLLFGSDITGKRK